MPYPTITIGTEKITGAPVQLELDNTNILIAGTRASGKTALARLIATSPPIAGITKTVIDTFNRWETGSSKNHKLAVHQGPNQETPLDPDAAASAIQRAWHTALEKSPIPELSQTILILDPHRPLPGMPRTEDQLLHALKTAKQYQFQSITIVGRLQDLDEDNHTQLSDLIAKKSKIFLFNHAQLDTDYAAQALQLTPYEQVSLPRLKPGDCLFINQPGTAPVWLTTTAPRGAGPTGARPR